MPGVGTCPMGRPMSPLRPITADGRTRGYIRRAPDRQRVCLFTAIALIGILPTINSKNITLEWISQGAIQNNGTVQNPSNLTNEIELNDDDDDDFYLGYSGYLRSSSSMLHLRSDYHNFNGNSMRPPSNDTVPQDSKAVGHRRLKRAVTHLYNMIICATGCNPLAYKGYGCYCGFLGSGYPMDGIDRCCKMHDWCYDASDCPMFVEYFVPYYWKCYRGYKPICAIDHGEWGSSGSCAQRLCECDRSFSECLRRYRCPRHKAVCTSSPWRLIQNLFMIV